MVQGLLLDRINTKTAGTPVGGQNDLITSTGPHKTQAALAIVKFAITRAKIALHPAIVEGVPVAPGKGRREDVIWRGCIHIL